jgi:hypothetical protein
VDVRRVLVTGSRDWDNPLAVYKALAAERLSATANGLILVVVHGQCPTGADLSAHNWCESQRTGGVTNVDEEPYPADWERDCDENCYHKPRTKNGKPYCPVAGHLRNQKMVDRGADVCLAFPLPDSRGTVDCMKRARKAGIPVLEFNP